MVGYIVGAAVFLVVFLGLMFYMMLYFPCKHTYVTHSPFKNSIFALMFIFLYGPQFFKVLADNEKGTPFSWSSYFTIFMFVIMSITFIPMFLVEKNYEKKFSRHFIQLKQMNPGEHEVDLEKRVEEMLSSKVYEKRGLSMMVV